MADVLDHLMQEHREVEQMLGRLKESEEGTERDELFAELTRSLRTHMAVEERFLYPILADVKGDEESADATDEHDLARAGLAEAEKRLAEGAFAAAIEILEAGIGHHVEEEESEQFPALREQAADRLARLDPAELEQKVDADGGSPSDGGPTRDELYEQAKEADIPGRSTMTKDELASALDDA